MSEKSIVTEAANEYGIEPRILWGLYGTETNYGRDTSTSSAGAVGPFQFLPSTAKSMGVDPRDFRSAAFGAAKYLSQYKGRGVGGMLSAYNAGPDGGYQSDYVSKTLANARGYDAGATHQGLTGAYPQDIHSQAAEHGVSPDLMQYLYHSELDKPEAEQKAAPYRNAASLFEGKGAGNELLRQALNAAGKQAAEPRPQQVISTPAGPQLVTPGSPDPQASNNLHGILPNGAQIVSMERKDQGRDVQLHPGQDLLAPGKFVYLGTKSDPSGFGPDYPIIRVLTGEFAGHDLYYGHTDAAHGLTPGKVYGAGTHVATTSQTGHNAPPGWLELGFAPGGTPGSFGQRSPF